MNRVVLALLSLLSLGVTCGPGSGPPPPDSCASPQTRTVADLEIGPEVIMERGFEPWIGDDVGYITAGFQGGYMLGVSLRLPADAPACLKQTTTVSLGGSVIATEDSPLNTYEGSDGTRTTKTAWLIFSDMGPPIGSQVTVKTVAAGKTTSMSLTIAQDRNRLESAVLVSPASTVGSMFEIELKSRIAPEFSSIEPAYSYSTPGVITAMPPQYIYSDTQRFQAVAIGAGQTDFIVKYRDQELRVPITIAP